MRGFLGGLLHWHGATLPTSESISGCATVEQAAMHIRSITTTGGQILGHRDLALDGIEPFLFVHGATVQRGFEPVRAYERADRDTLPTFSWWGYDVISIKANKRFVGSDGN